MAPIRISRSGLSRCPTCKSHIKVAAVVQETRCPFCDGTLAAPSSRVNLSLTPSSRSALVAASLFASAGWMPGCASDDSSSADAVIVEPAPDSTSDTAADGSWAQEIVEDAGSMPAYGIPPDASWDASPEVEIVEDAGSMPEYGMPPDAGPLPPYGIPPDGW